jgi:alpha-L-fucosidase 2
VFPALPTAWHDAEFHDLRAEGAFLISAKRSAGKTQWVRIHSLAGEPCLVKPAIDGPIRIEGDADAEIITLSPGIHQINLGKNREVLLVPDS